MWGVAVLGSLATPAIPAVAVVIGLVFVLRFYLTLYQVWEPESGVTPRRMMFVPGFSRARFRAGLHLRDPFRPSWIRYTLRITGWNARFVGLALLTLLLSDLAIGAAVLPHLAATAPSR